MKSAFFFLILLCATAASYGQDILNEKFLDETLQPVDSTEAVFVRHFQKVSSTQIDCEILHLTTGETRMTGSYVISGGQLLENGLFTFYHEKNQVESTGHFILGFKSGVWKRFSSDGSSLPDKYYDPNAADILRRLNNVGLE